MAELQIFKNDEFGEVRTTTIDHKLYFCGSDVAKALGYANTFDALTKHCEEDGIASCEVIDTLGRKQEARFISEGNVHRLIVAASKQSRNKDIQERAKKYANWIFDEIMPTIRKDGYYSLPGNEKAYQPKATSAGEVASLLKPVIRVMERQGSRPFKVAKQTEKTLNQFGIETIPDFVEEPQSQPSEQLSWEAVLSITQHK